MGITGTADGVPLKAGPGVGDIYPAALAALGIVAAVRHAERTGRGSWSTSAWSTPCSRCASASSTSTRTAEQVPGPEGNAHPMLCPFENFPTEDGWVTIAAPGDAHWQLLCGGMGRPELGGDERFSTSRDRVRNAPETRRVVREWTERPHARAKRWRRSADRCRPVRCRPCATSSRTRTPAAATCWSRSSRPAARRKVVYAGMPIKLTATPGGVYRRPPRLGEHTAEMLAEFGIATDVLAR